MLWTNTKAVFPCWNIAKIIRTLIVGSNVLERLSTGQKLDTDSGNLDAVWVQKYS